MKLDDIRKRIDGIDRELIGLLRQRMEWSLKTQSFKKDVIDRKREKEVLDRAGRYAKKSLYLSPQFIRTLFKLIIGEGRRIQEEKMMHRKGFALKPKYPSEDKKGHKNVRRKQNRLRKEEYS